MVLSGAGGNHPYSKYMHFYSSGSAINLEEGSKSTKVCIDENILTIRLFYIGLLYFLVCIYRVYVYALHSQNQERLRKSIVCCPFLS